MKIHVHVMVKVAKCCELFRIFTLVEIFVDENILYRFVINLDRAKL